jgi:predicted unusual protein kinase regulating ubiquinone biosynthesis (AarF/ABC1/UbiB family)/ribosomal protein L7/L12
MRDDVRSEVARRLAKAGASLPTSWVGRPARLVGGLAWAGAGSLGRSVRRRFGWQGSDPGPEAAVAATLGRLKGVPMKVGQVLGYVDLGVPESLRAALSALHTCAQPLPIDRVRAVLEADLGDAGRALARTLSPEPLAVVSVGQVHRAVLPDGTHVAVKVQHPGLAETIVRDFAPATVTSRMTSFVYRRRRLDTFVADVRTRLVEECDYALEAQRQARFAAIFADHPTVVVPAVHPAWSSSRILTTTFIDGLHLDAHLATRPSAAANNRAGEALFDVYIGTLFRHGLYNCDPHPGNYLFLPDGRVAVVDFGCTGQFAPGFVARFASLLDAVRAHDDEHVHRALVDLGAVADSRRYDAEAIRWLLGAFFGPLVRDDVVGFDVAAGIRLVPLLRRWWRARALSVSPELPFLLRTFLGVSAVLTRLGARANWYRRLRESEVTARAEAATAETIPTSPPATIPPEEADTSTWDLVLIDPGSSEIAVVRELRALTGLELAQVKHLMDASPRTIRQAVSRADAEALRIRLENAGANVEVRRSSRA